MLENNQNPSMEEILLSIKSILSGENEKSDNAVVEERQDVSSSKVFNLTKEMLIEVPKAFIASGK